MVNPPTTSWSEAPDACKAVPIDGIATLTTKTSMMHMNWPSSSTASISAPETAGADPAGRAAAGACPRREAGTVMGSSFGHRHDERVVPKGTGGAGFGDAALQEAAFGGGARASQRFAEGGPGLVGTAEAAQQLGPGRVPVLVVRQ